VNVDLTCRPIERWPGRLRTDDQRLALPFRATWTDTVRLLETELAALGVDSAAVQVAVTERDLRRDGWIKADAKPAHPGIIVTFDHPRHGPLSYPCDTFAGGSAYGRGSGWRDIPGWQANTRAVALGLESLRKVDRYGIASHGEQYTGWRQLGAGIATPAAQMTVEEAARFIGEHAHWHDQRDPSIIVDPDVLRVAYRAAAMALHPDTGGDDELFKRLDEAKRIIEAHRG
jgi:hypothetical protein